jgi:hypothetical protein
VGLAQGGRREVGVLRVAPAAGERDLARVAAQVVAPAGQHDRRLAVGVQEQGHEHGGVGTAVDFERGGLDGVQQDPLQPAAQVSGRA